MGAWSFVSTFIEEVAEEVGLAAEASKPRYAGRPVGGFAGYRACTRATWPSRRPS